MVSILPYLIEVYIHIFTRFQYGKISSFGQKFGLKWPEKAKKNQNFKNPLSNFVAIR